MIFIALLIYIIKLLGGFFLVHLIWDSRELKALIFKFFLGAGMGAGVSSLLYFLWSWVFLPLAFYPIFELALFVLFAIAVWRKESRQDLRSILSQVAVRQKATFVWGACVALAVGICLASFWIQANAVPHGIYDAWDIWNIGARFVYLSQTDWVGVMSQSAWDHMDYPLLVTLNVAEGWSIIGSAATRVPVAFSAFFMLSFIGMAFSSVSIAKDFQQGALAAILVASLPELTSIGSFQYAEIQLAYFFLATASLLYLYTIEPNVKFIFLAALFGGFAAWTKNEGEPFLVLILLICIILSLKERKNLLKPFALGVLLPAVVIMLFKSIAPPADLFVDKAKSFQELFELSRYQLILAQLWEKGSSFGFWPISFLGILLLYMISLWKSRGMHARLWIPFGLFLAQFAGYMLIYVMTPHDLYWQLNTSLDRLLFQISPLLVFGVFCLLPSPRELFANDAVAQP